MEPEMRIEMLVNKLRLMGFGSASREREREGEMVRVCGYRIRPTVGEGRGV